LNDPATQQRIQAVLQQAAALKAADGSWKVVGVGNPANGQGGGVSKDGKTAYAAVQYDRKAQKMPDSVVTPLFALVDGSKGNGLPIEAGGPVVETHEKKPDRSEIYGMLAAAVILLVAFGSVVAMGLPLATALAGLLAGLAGTGLLSRVIDLP